MVASTEQRHWSKEPGRWEPDIAPESWAYIPRIQAPAISPDGTKAAYVRSLDGRQDIWVVDIASGQSTQITDTVTPQGADPNQRQAFPLTWTPDSQTVIFAASGDGKLYAIPADGGKARRIEEAAGNHHSPAVSPDGSKVAFVAERDENVDIMIASIDGRQIRQVTDPDDDRYAANPRWSPDGDHVMFVQWPHYDMPWDEIAISIASAAGYETVAAGERVANNWAQWSPDGKEIAFVSDRDGEHPNLTRMRADGSKIKTLQKEDYDHHRPVWSPNGKRIAFTRNESNENQIRVFEGRKARQITSVPGVHGDLAWIDDEHLLCTFESPELPPDLWVIGVDGSRRQITQSATGTILATNLKQPEVISWKSRDDMEITGMLFEPDEIRPGEHPLVVHIHGGPVGQANKTWIPWIQELVQRGYLVLVPNYRGSKGYGRSFMEALYGDWGGGDLQDYITGTEAVIERGAVNPKRVVATGGSAGGYSTLICMTKAPDVFKAGIARFGIADLKTFHEKTWVFEKYYLAKLMGGTGGQLPELYEDRSPINFVDDVKGPILILQGDS
ncbi:MAG: S9 family peptidase, partial [Chloroflexota bacterium]